MEGTVSNPPTITAAAARKISDAASAEFIAEYGATFVRLALGKVAVAAAKGAECTYARAVPLLELVEEDARLRAMLEEYATPALRALGFETELTAYTVLQISWRAPWWRRLLRLK